jgi:hypothetical protein
MLFGRTDEWAVRRGSLGGRMNGGLRRGSLRGRMKGNVRRGSLGGRTNGNVRRGSLGGRMSGSDFLLDDSTLFTNKKKSSVKQPSCPLPLFFI